jgi:hypothetical protein
MGKRLGGFVPPPRLIPEIDSNCSRGRETGQGCVKELRNRIKPNFPGGTYGKCGNFSSQASSSFPPPKLLAVQGFKAMGTPGCWEPLAVGDNRTRRSTHRKQRAQKKHPGTTVDFKPATSRGFRNVADTLRLPNVSNPPPSGFIPR